MHIRYWDSETDRLKVHYLDSSFMGKSFANDVFEHFANDAFEHFVSSIQTIDKAKLSQVFSDGLNVNLAFLELLK